MGSSRPPITWLRVLAWLALLGSVLLVADQVERFVFYEITAKDRGSVTRLMRRPVKDALLRTLHAVAPEVENPASLPVFDFYLKPEDEQFLRDRITRVQLIGTHDEITKEEVPARMRVEGEEYDVRLKLRGRQYYHVVDPRPSLRVQLRHNRSYRGSTVFNLIDPFDKTGDLVFLWEARAHGLVCWDTTMGILALRGEPLGVVQFVEQPRIAMGDHAGRPEGMFFRGSGEHYSEGADPERCGKVVERVVSWLGRPEDTIGYEELEELFDVERLRWFTALTELSGDGHGFADFNMKGYCDPVSLRAEMMIWDTRFGDWSALPGSQFAAEGTQLLRCDRFRVLHDQALYELVSQRLPAMLARADEFYSRYGEALAEDPFSLFPRGGPDGGFMADRPEKLRRTLTKNGADIRAALEGTHLAWHVDAATHTLELASDDRGSKLVTALALEGEAGTVTLALPEALTVPGSYRDRRPVLVVDLPPGVTPDAVRGVEARAQCGGAEVAPVASATPLAGARIEPARAPAPAELPALPPGIEVDAAAHLVRIGPGSVRPEGSLTFPRGWKVAFEPGTELLLAGGANFEIQGDLSMPGRADAPVVVRPAGAEPWGAFAVLGERTHPPRVEIAHTTFSGGAGSNAGSRRCTGSVAIYFADVTMDHVTVERNTSEDALNLKFCSLAATDCLYRDGASDAVDYDFCNGTDVRTRIERFGNDGIDVSGSRMRVQGTVVSDVGDKGFSVGEGSQPEYVDVTVRGAHTGVAVKDKSDARFEGLTVLRCDTAAALYMKKESFGPSRALFRDLLVLDTDAMIVLDQGCQATFENARRLGARSEEMRPFAGIQSQVEPGIQELSLEELQALATRLRAER